MLFDRHAPEVFQHVLLQVAETGRLGVGHNLPGMTPEHCGEPHQPVGRELPFAKFQVANLLVRSADPRCKFSQCEALSLTQFLKPIRQNSRSFALNRSLQSKAHRSRRDVPPASAEISPTFP